MLGGVGRKTRHLIKNDLSLSNFLDHNFFIEYVMFNISFPFFFLLYFFSNFNEIDIFRYKYTFGTQTFSESSMWYPNFRNVQFGTPTF